jgi:ubiquinone/menaquinone biosynthesis C-methylase UbiE
MTAIDYSEEVVRQVSEKHAKGKDLEKKAAIRYVHMDARKLQLASDSFGCVIDKGTCDAMLCPSKPEEGFKNVRAILTEAVRVLQTDSAACIVLVSHICPESDEFDDLLTKCVLPSLETKAGFNWKIDAHEVESSTSSKRKKSDFATVYVIESIPRRTTRSTTSGNSQAGNVAFKVHTYTS